MSDLLEFAQVVFGLWVAVVAFRMSRQLRETHRLAVDTDVRPLVRDAIRAAHRGLTWLVAGVILLLAASAAEIFLS